ncbi:hypothetical protein BH10ACI4_BH10ACI4_04190 [soil metagenome]
MFPTGLPGAAILVLRGSVAASLIYNSATQWSPQIPVWMIVGTALLAIFLSLGLLTPYSSVLASLIQLYLLSVGLGGNRFCLILSILIGGILAVLGPGAYSLDARIFGRKILRLPRRR